MEIHTETAFKLSIIYGDWAIYKTDIILTYVTSHQFEALMIF